MKGLLTKSRLGCARKCKRLHLYQYELGYRPVQDEDTQYFGTVMHRALDPWWRAWMEPEDVRLEAGLATLQAVEDPFLRARAEVMLTAYHVRYAAEPFEVLGVESSFRTELRNPKTGAVSRTWDLGGQLDVLLLDLRDQQKKFMEHKTSGEDITVGSNYWKRLRMDTQVSVYFEGARALGHDVSECIYDVLGKPAQRPGNVPLLDENGLKIVLDANGERVKTKDGKKFRESADSAAGYVLQTRPETPEEFKERLTEVMAADPNRYLVRGTVVRLAGELADALTDTWQLAQEIREAELADRWPRNPDACVRVDQGVCPFFGVCTNETSIDDPSRFKRLADVHPELSNPQPAVQEVQSA